MRTRSAIVLTAVFSAFGLMGCRQAADNSSSEARPVSEVLAAGRAPVEMGAAAPATVSIGAPTFKVTVRNVTDARMDSVLWTVVAFDRAGNLIPDGEVDGGYADILNPIGSGETAELSFMVSSEEAVRVKLVLKEVIYVPPDSEGGESPGRPRKWTNPYYSAELKTVRGIAMPD